MRLERYEQYELCDAGRSKVASDAGGSTHSKKRWRASAIYPDTDEEDETGNEDENSVASVAGAPKR